MVAMQSIGVTDQTSGYRGLSEWQRAHEELSRLASARASADAEEGSWLLCALRSAAHVHLGFGSFIEYIERLFGYSPRSIQEKLRVAEALEELPETYDALASGKLNWSTVRELTRVTIKETEREWLAAAHGKTARQLEQLVAGKAPGDRPTSPNRAGARRHVLRFEVSAETLALVREAFAKLRRSTDSSLDDDSALLLMARQVLGDPTEDGRAPYQVALTICEKCERGFQQSRGELVEVNADVVAMAKCDCQHLGHAEPATTLGAHTGVIPSKESKQSRARATQTLAPALRRTILRRDQHCCVLPGCRQSVFVDIHHIELRSEGGQHEASNLITLCAAHHRAQHRGELTIARDTSGQLSFRHADGTPYGQSVAPRTVDAFAKAFAALRSMGFREKQVRAALDAIRSKQGSGANIQSILRSALLILTQEPSATQ